MEPVMELQTGSAAVGLFLVLAILAVVAVFSIGLFALWIWMLIDCATREPEGSEKIVWILVIIFLHGLGALIYLFARKLPRDRQRTGPAPGQALPPGG